MSKIPTADNHVLTEINALGLINVLDIFKFTLTAKDAEIEKRYGSEEKALQVADKYLSLIKQCNFLCDGAIPLPTSIKITQPTTSGETRETFYEFSKSETPVMAGKIDFIEEGES